jgi:hypothetical protein
LGGDARRPKVLFNYNYQNGITYEEEDIMPITKAKLFSITTINLPQTISLEETTNVEIMDTIDNINNLEQNQEYIAQNIKQLAKNMSQK